MRIEAGEYETRGGADVVVIAIVDSIAIGYYAKHGPQSVSRWRSDNGKFFVETQRESAADLVCKKPKRIKKKVWVTVYKECRFVVGGGYDSLEDAKENTTENCVAITSVEIDCEEGENLD